MTDLKDEGRTRLTTSVLQAFLNDTGGVLLDAQLENFA